ncbi:hypothetical protein OXIME_000915 [Oxyplasma meridianum]|uniref:Sodium/calcium exchanger membrane region domain-containing protein n=1 Tax=Oxyplasma meridianum TaxID=3073602 RepID=A0AAX4NGQ7_9ARCH
MISPYLILLLSISIVIFASYLFVDGLEYIETHLGWSETFTGSIASPIFTSFPELVVILVAIFAVGNTAGDQIGIGTIFGEPFMASTVGYSAVLTAVVLAFFKKRRKTTTVLLQKNLIIPYIFNAAIFPVLVIPVFFFTRDVQYFTGIGLIAFYFIYFIISSRNRKSKEVIEKSRPILSSLIKAWKAAILEISIASVVLYYGSVFLVSSIRDISLLTSISPMSLSILLVPVATIIPETLTASFWAYRGKDTTALASLVGEKVIFTTIFPGLVLLLIPWKVDFAAYFSVVATVFVSVMYIPFIIRGKMPAYSLAAGLAFFAVFAYATLMLHI